METIFYSLDATRLTSCDLASGETAPRVRYRPVSRSASRVRAGGPAKVLDLEEYRRRLAEEEAGARGDEDWPDEYYAPVRYEAVLPPPARSVRRRKARTLALGLDFCATLAILILVAVVVRSFLPLL